MHSRVIKYFIYYMTIMPAMQDKILQNDKKEKRLLLDGYPNGQVTTEQLAQLVSSLQSQVLDLKGQQNMTESQVKILREELQRKQSESEQTISILERDLRNALAQAGGSTYIIWGRTDCPGNGTELVYSGYVGGSLYSETGGASEYVCLPKDPQWGTFDLALSTGGHMYGGEYEFNYPYQLHRFFGQNLRDHNAPCAVCSSVRPHVLMIPARTSCYGGWTLEYNGYLTTGGYAHKAPSQYVCLDDTPELVSSGVKDEGGKLFYLVEGKCGSLECPPYVEGKEFACVVCTK